MALNIPPQYTYFYKSNWAPNIDQSLLDSIIRLKLENDLEGMVIPKPFFIIAASDIEYDLGIQLQWNALYERLQFLEQRYLSFKALVKEDGTQWIMGENVVIASDETWASIFKKNKLASAYYYEGEPEFNRLSVMFGPKEIKEEKRDDVIVLSDNTIPATSTEVIISEGLENEAKGPKSRRKLFDEATRAGDCESTNITIRSHYYIMGPNGKLERKMFSPKPRKNDGRPPIPNASPGGSSCASSASPVGWRSKYTK
ncbi:hypothetical protein AAHA92_11954 [Salvia divinorum]|uniref:Uncharacterized protein n=1 Tax=Salvia divinorum TaxID=28513 RepID=A0ABD1HK06_SALDI